MPDDLAQPVGAWQWDGTREGGRRIANATDQPVHVLCERGDETKAPRFLEVSGTRQLLAPGDWIVRSADGRLHAVDAEVFDAIRAAALRDFPDIEGAPV